jgi:hypothetical protein
VRETGRTYKKERGRERKERERGGPAGLFREKREKGVV